MPFLLEFLDDAARQSNRLDVVSWAVNRERGMAVWVNLKHWQLRADGDVSEDVTLRVGNAEYQFNLMPASSFALGAGSAHHEYVWESIVHISPLDLHGQSYSTVVAHLKEGLAAFGGGWNLNRRFGSFSVSFKF